MGACNSTNNKRPRINNNPGIDEYAEHRSKYQKEIKTNPFFMINSSSLQEKLTSAFENSNQGPNTFISSQSKYTPLFKKQFELSYLKCMPLLNNVFTTNEKQAQLLFLNIALFFLSNGGSIDRKCELAQRLFLEAYDNGQRAHNIGKLCDMVRNVINIAMIIIIYFGAVFIFMNEEMKGKVFGDENIRIEDKYDFSTLDSYFFDKFAESINRDMNDELFIAKWEQFIYASFKFPDKEGGENEVKTYDNFYVLLSEQQKEDFKYRFCHMSDPLSFFEVFLKLEVPKYEQNVYKNQNSDK